MIIYYLCVKTHTITGLKYLCQTKSKTPKKYLGSGIYWKKHLKIHGPTITTCIVKECYSKKELTYWGEFYSDLWDVVNRKDWANLIPEVGSGGRTTWGATHCMKRPEIVAKVSGQYHYTKKKGYDPKNHPMRGYDHTGSRNPRYDPTIYSFINILTGEIEQTTRYELAKKYNLNLGNLSKVFSGKYKHCGGWKLVSKM